MKKISIFLIGTLIFVNNAMAGILSDYLDNKVSKDAISDDLVSEPMTFEDKLDALAKEIKENNLLQNSENRIKILELEKEITLRAISHNQKAESKNKMIRLGGIVVGAVIGGVIGYKMSGGSAEVTAAGKNVAEVVESILERGGKTIKVVGVSLVSAAVGGGMAYVVVKTDLGSKYLTIQEIDLKTINLDTTQIE